MTKDRDYKKEYADYQGKPEQIKKRAMRNKARADKEKSLGRTLGKDEVVDHIKPLRKGGENTGSNTRVISRSKNAAWRKGKDGYD